MRTGLAETRDRENGDFDSFVAGEGVASKINILSLVLQGFTAAAEMPEVAECRDRIVPLFKISTRGREFRLTRPLALKVYGQGELTIAENESLQLLTYGESVRDALASFAEAFDVLYEEVVGADPSVLSGNAQRLRRVLRDLVRSAS